MINPEDFEEWRGVPSLPEYEASSWGRIRRRTYIAPMPHGGVRTYGGLAWFGAWDDDQGRYVFLFKGKTRRVAKVVCEAFNGPPPFPRAVVMHDDENSRNNRPENLIWGTQRQNLNATRYLEYRRNNPGRPNSKTTPEQRQEIIRRGMSGERISDLAREFKISPAYVSTMMTRARQVSKNECG